MAQGKGFSIDLCAIHQRQREIYITLNLKSHWHLKIYSHGIALPSPPWGGGGLVEMEIIECGNPA